MQARQGDAALRSCTPPKATSCASTPGSLPLQSAQDFADRLAIHVNHFNRYVKEVTGKPTTSHIADRIIGEAKALLHHTSWDVAEIGQSLGFEYSSYFNNFFKKHTGSTPLSFGKTV